VAFAQVTSSVANADEICGGIAKAIGDPGMSQALLNCICKK
jgi:hypothetical protein